MPRKTVAQAEELERKIFGTRQIGVIANVEQAQSGTSRKDTRQGNDSLDNEHETTERADPQDTYEEITL